MTWPERVGFLEGFLYQGVKKGYRTRRVLEYSGLNNSSQGSGTRCTVLGGSWVVVSGVISKVTVVITYIRGLITTHEPPSTVVAVVAKG